METFLAKILRKVLTVILRRLLSYFREFPKHRINYEPRDEMTYILIKNTSSKELTDFCLTGWFGMPINGVPNMHNMPINPSRMSHLPQLPGVPYAMNQTLLEGQYAALHDPRYIRGHRHAPYPTVSANQPQRPDSKVMGEFKHYFSNTMTKVV